jgi:hypothetical protein
VDRWRGPAAHRSSTGRADAAALIASADAATLVASPDAEALVGAAAP